MDSPQLDSSNFGNCFDCLSWNVGLSEDFECRSKLIHSSGIICVATFLDEFSVGRREATALGKARDKLALLAHYGGLSDLAEKGAIVNERVDFLITVFNGSKRPK
jgi:hypothetical protein